MYGGDGEIWGGGRMCVGGGSARAGGSRRRGGDGWGRLWVCFGDLGFLG